MKSRLYSWEGLLLVTFLIIFAFNTITQPQFLTVSNQINMFQLSIEKLIVVLVMAFIIINAEIDLSVGSMMGLSACAFGWSFQHGLDPALAIVLCLAIGAAGGALNGFFVAYMGLPSLVVTLATLIGFRGLARVMVEDRGITNFPDWFDAVGQQGFIGPVPFALVCFVIMFAVAWIVLEHSGVGRKTFRPSLACFMPPAWGPCAAMWQMASNSTSSPSCSSAGPPSSAVQEPLSALALPS